MGLPAAEFKVDWDAVRRGENDATIEEELFHHDVENYLVDLKTNRVLASLRAAQAWRLPSGTSANRGNLEICWSPENDLAIADYSEKWGYTSVEVFRIAKDGAASPAIEIGDQLEKPWRAHLARTEGRRYAKRAGNLAISFSEYTAEGRGKFSVRVFAEVPKGESEDDFFGDQRIRFTLTPARAGIAVKVVGIEPITEPSATAADERLAASDRQLNSAYRELIGLLDEAAVKKLRTEQRAWLKERDAVEDPETRAAFIEARVRVLLDRVRGAKR